MGQTKNKGLMLMSKPEYYIANFSGGKDSTAMVLELIARNYPLDEVVCCDTTVEFPAMYRHIEKVRKVVEDAGIRFTVLRAEHDFEYYLLHYKPKRKNPDRVDKPGMTWPGPVSRWCTGVLKTRIIDKYMKGRSKQYTVRGYIGIAANEGYRLERQHNRDPNHLHPLVEWNWTEADCMTYCRDRGYDWEGLYDIFSRVSCYLCPLQPVAELRKLWKHFPDLWTYMDSLDKQTFRTFLKDGWSVERLGRRFMFEEVLEEAGCSIKDRQFYIDLRRHCFDGVSVEMILEERGYGQIVMEGVET